MKVPMISPVAFAVALLLSAGCGLAGVRSTPSRPPATGATVSAIGAATPVTSLAPTATPESTPISTRPSPTAAGSTRPPATDPVSLTPPRGHLDGGSDPVEAWLGSFCWQGTCADVPAFPDKDALPEVTYGSRDMEFTLAGGVQFVSWIASYGDDELSLQPLAQGGEDFDPDAVSSSAPAQLTGATFVPPPNGDWLLTVQVFFSDGDATYAWHAVADE